VLPTISFVRIADVFACWRQKRVSPLPGKPIVQRTPELAADIQAAHYTGNHERGGPPHQDGFQAEA